MNKLKLLFDEKLVKFLLVGVLNTLLSAVIMFLLYNLAHFGYWGSSAIAYLLGALLSFFLNRRFTFQSSRELSSSALRFAITVSLCYLIAYGLSKPLVLLVLSKSGISLKISEQIAMLFGMCLYTGLNYLGQRFFAFGEK